MNAETLSCVADGATKQKALTELLAQRDAAQAESRGLAASLDAALAELRQRTSERDQARTAIKGLLRHCVKTGGFQDVGKGRTSEQQAAYDQARAALGADKAGGL